MNEGAELVFSPQKKEGYFCPIATGRVTQWMAHYPLLGYSYLCY